MLTCVMLGDLRVSVPAVFYRVHCPWVFKSTIKHEAQPQQRVHSHLGAPVTMEGIG